MKRFQVAKEDECLTLSMPMDYARFTLGILLFFLAIFCNFALAALGILEEERALNRPGASDPLRFFLPGGNPFGFLWLVSTILMLILIPFYMSRIRRSGLTYRFHRTAGVSRLDDKGETLLDHIEHILIRSFTDPEGERWQRLLIIYADGQELFIDDSYDEDEMSDFAYDLADYAAVEVVRK